MNNVATIRLCIEALDEEQFEQWITLLIESTNQIDGRAERNGVSGSKQQGVDHYARVRGVGMVGYQAKAYHRKKLSITAFDAELSAAHDFKPPLRRYTVVYTQPRNTALQERARLATIHGHHAVDILFLDSLAEIAARHDELRRHLFRMTISAEDAEDVLRVSGRVTTLPISVSAESEHRTLSPQLRRAEEWIDAGLPEKAIAVLEAETPSEEVDRIMARALFAAGRTDEVVDMACNELSKAVPNAAMLAIGAQAANKIGNRALSEQLIDGALQQSAPDSLDVISAYIRVHAGNHSVSQLEEFAAARLPSANAVALALADAALLGNDYGRAAFWFGEARKTRPQLPVGSIVNESAALLSAHDPMSSVRLANLISDLERVRLETDSSHAVGLRFALLSNLGQAYFEADDLETASERWDEALAIDGDAEDLWIRRCIVASKLSVRAPGEVLVHRYTQKPWGKLAYVGVLLAQGELDGAGTLLNEVATESADPDLHGALEAERHRLMAARGGIDAAMTRALERSSEIERPYALLAWMVFNYKDVGAALKQSVQGRLFELREAEVEEGPLIALVLAMCQVGLQHVAAMWHVELHARAVTPEGEIKDPLAADALADVYVELLKFDQAIELRRMMLDRAPSDSRVWLRLARTQAEAGLTNAAFETLDVALDSGRASASSLFNWALLAVRLGRKRYARMRIEERGEIQLKTHADRIKALQAHALLGARGGDHVALSLLQEGAGPESLGGLFGLGLGLKRKPQDKVAIGTVVHVRIPGWIDERILITERPAHAVPGARNLDLRSYPWVGQLLGLEVGDTAVLSTAPMAGAVAEIISISSGLEFAVSRAGELIALANPVETGITAVVGTPDEQLAFASKEVAKHDSTLTTKLEVATNSFLPICHLSETLHTPVRAFLRQDATWTPRAHTGTREDIEEDDRQIEATSTFVLDPVTLLLALSIGAEDIFRVMPQRIVMTRLAVEQLRDFYFAERIDRNRVGRLMQRPDGGVMFVEDGVQERQAQRSFWRRVSNLIGTRVELVDSVPIPAEVDALRFGHMLGASFASSMSLAREPRYALVSEELSVRTIAGVGYSARSVSLQRLIAVALQHHRISAPVALRWISALIEAGWTWVAFPLHLIRVAISSAKDEQQVLLGPLLRRSRDADAEGVVQVFLDLLDKLDRGQIATADAGQLRDMLISGLPKKTPRDSRKAAAHNYLTSGPIKSHFQTYRGLVAWSDAPVGE